MLNTQFNMVFNSTLFYLHSSAIRSSLSDRLNSIGTKAELVMCVPWEMDMTHSSGSYTAGYTAPLTVGYGQITKFN